MNPSITLIYPNGEEISNTFSTGAFLEIRPNAKPEFRKSSFLIIEDLEAGEPVSSPAFFVDAKDSKFENLTKISVSGFENIGFISESLISVLTASIEISGCKFLSLNGSPDHAAKCIPEFMNIQTPIWVIVNTFKWEDYLTKLKTKHRKPSWNPLKPDPNFNIHLCLTSGDERNESHFEYKSISSTHGFESKGSTEYLFAFNDTTREGTKNGIKVRKCLVLTNVPEEGRITLWDKSSLKNSSETAEEIAKHCKESKLIWNTLSDHRTETAHLVSRFTLSTPLSAS